MFTRHRLGPTNKLDSPHAMGTNAFSPQRAESFRHFLLLPSPSSVITSKVANGYHFKTGQWKVPGTKLLYSASTRSGKSDHDRSRRSGSVLRSFFCAEAIAHFTTHDPVGVTRGGSGCPASCGAAITTTTPDGPA